MIRGGVSAPERALLELALERAEAALACLEGEPIALTVAALRLEALVRLGRKDEARGLLDRVDDAGLAARCRGLVTDGDFDADFLEALELLRDEEFERARTRLLYGERLRRAGRRSAARRQLRLAHETFARLASAPWTERARRELDSTAETRGVRGSDVLTKQERHVAALAAEGLSNKEIAAKLVVTAKTVEFHLGNVYRKLDVRSRAALARRLTDRATPSAAPVAPDSLLGRDEDLRRLERLLETERIVTLTGAGGSGKTRLARAVAETASASTFVDLGSVRETALVIWAIARALDVRDVPGEPLAETVAASLRSRPRLVVLDNFEQLVEAATLVEELAAAAPECTFLVTSRVALRLREEREYVVAPLATAAAIELFVARARAVDPAFALTSENRDTIATIVARLDGLPLAVELAAARTTLLSPRSMLERLDDRLALLTRGSRGAPERQQTLRATLDWSYDLLDPELQALFSALGVFVGSFSADAAEEVAGGTLDGLDALLEHNLLKRDSAETGPRLGMLETVREYACGRLAASEAADSVRRRHTLYFLAIADTHDEMVERGRVGEWGRSIAIDYANVRAALEEALAAGDHDSTLRIAAALGFYWRSRGDAHEGGPWLERVLEEAKDPDHPSYAYVMFTAGCVAGFEGDPLLQIERFEQALALFRRTGNTTWVARLHAFLCRAFAHRSDLERARREAEAAIAVARTLDSGPELARALAELAEIHVYLGDADSALPLADEAIVLGAPQRARVLGNVHRTRAQVHLLNGDVDRARADLDEALAIERDGGHLPSISTCCIYRGFVALLDGQPDVADAFFGEAVEAGRGEAWPVSAALRGYADVALRSGPPDRAARLLGAADALDPRLDREVLGGLGRHLGQVREAVAAQLGDERAAHERRLGANMPAEEALALASGS